MILYNFQSITRKGKYKIDFVMMLSRNDCVLKTSGNFKITSLVARYSLSSTRQPITSSLISPLGIVPLLPSLIITPRSYEACTQQSFTQYTNIFAYFLHSSLFAPCILFTVDLTWGRVPVCSPGLLLSLCDVTPEPEPRPELAPPPPAWSHSDRSRRPGSGARTMVRWWWYHKIE